MHSTLDFTTWGSHEIFLLTELLTKLRERKLTDLLKERFDFNSMKIAFNEKYCMVYMYDKNGNLGSHNHSIDGWIHLIDDQFQEIDGENEMIEGS